MTIQEKLQSFDPNEPRIHVFHEGMFAKLYNESAFLFTKHVRRYKVNVTESKRGRHYSLGFPFTLLDELLGDGSGWLETEIDPDYRIYGAPVAAYDAQEYEAWCGEAERAAHEAEAKKAERAKQAAEKHGTGSGNVVSEAGGAGTAPMVNAGLGNGNMLGAAFGNGTVAGCTSPEARTRDSAQAILSDILRFRLESATPLECMLFMQTIQKRCYDALPEFTSIQGRL